MAFPVVPGLEAADLLTLTARLVDVPSVSHDEAVLADLVEAWCRGIDGLTVDRVGDNVVARTQRGAARRVVLAGHLDTVPPHDNATARVDGDVLWGLGSADMKAGLAVMLDALCRDGLAVDVTAVFYACEEVASVHSGLGALVRDRPELLAGDVALLGEPTGATLEAGCQGTLRVRVTMAGRRAHTARAWMGTNAVHRLGPVLSVFEGYEARRPVIDGCEYREALQAVEVTGGVATNVVPDVASVLVNHRFAPDRSEDEALDHVLGLLAPHLGPDDRVERTESVPAAAPGLDHPALAALVGRNDLTVRAKLGWTDVARFAAIGIPAANLGPGDPTLAHTADERVERHELDRVSAAVGDLLRTGW
ncbi:MAG: succinyl-diaminopimelate desuccinylase [Actinomycetota bacterium]|nr:succinyl-diaminopimelate desuccinylase [Actinomycetota bacterium]